ncbi:citrate synthase [Halalkalicoccus jeotgali]|uniref:Citrate synthase n=1 Tax=Halalkalicoccus jeotgali (strain DSM 18796 / CECT 7217 / JCM 14584 / KCTC 4019 / B3) TaxID=795797 RepID=D8J5B9_HALJB|nr:citrate synthase [Halalkalicoccus jeotgali]ADJ13700.1 2-methylcitrate synthase/citrate synthase II [Halalkalicoccus jeotgali B3]ELY34253.1 2-methylcitrate synthase/citrate synthase II [Halalkalicoccus jeotgali B3]
MADDLKKGLEGVLVAESSLSHIDGDEGTLIYRGYAIEDLAREASYEEVLYLLWYGELPTHDELDSFTERMVAERAVDEDVLATAEALATADAEPMAALRTVVSQLSVTDPDGETDPEDREATLAKSRRLTAKIPTIIAAFDRYRDDDEPVEPREDLSHAANFLYMLNGEEPDEIAEETFDAALVLHADHGLNASTFSAMVTASTLSDVHSAVTSAIGTLKGGLHGGANQNVMEMLKEVDDSDKDPVKWARDALDSGRRVAGFGHRVYEVKDPRAYILGEFSESLAEEAGEMKWYDYSVAIEEFMSEEKGIAPNVDFYSATTYYQMGIPIDLFTPIFALSRVGGWTAHVTEQYEDNRIMRPRARYVGDKNQEFVPIDER